MTPRDPGPTRTAILLAASELLESGGPEAVTLRAVGEAAGVSRSAAYRHFDDKSALLSALAATALNTMATEIRAAAIHDNMLVNLRRGSGAYVNFALQNPHHYQLVFGHIPVTSSTPHLEAAADSAMASLQELIEHAQSTGQLGGGPPRELATVLWVLLHGIAALQITGHLHEPRTLDGSTRLEELLDLALTSFRPVSQT